MPPDQNTTQNQDSTENSIPLSPSSSAQGFGETQPTVTDPSYAEFSGEARSYGETKQEPTELTSENTAYSKPSDTENNSILTENSKETKPEELPPSASLPEEKPPVSSEPAQTSEPRTAQIPVNEPLASKPSPDFAKDSLDKQKDLWKKFLDKVQIGKRKKLEKIMTLFLKHSKITNDEVEKLLHVSDATATRYLSQLEKEGKIKQTGKTGHAVSYSRI